MYTVMYIHHGRAWTADALQHVFCVAACTGDRHVMGLGVNCVTDGGPRTSVTRFTPTGGDTDVSVITVMGRWALVTAVTVPHQLEVTPTCH